MHASMEVKEKDECFTYHDGDNDTYHTFLVGLMTRFFSEYPTCSEIIYTKIDIKGENYNHAINNMGIERDRVKRLKEPYLSRPAICVEWPAADGPNDVILIDGNHRLVKYYEMGVQKINVVIFKNPFWQQFTLDQEVMPRFMAERDPLNTPSRILENERTKK